MKINRVFLGPIEIAGYNKNLKAAFQDLGIECTFIDTRNHSFQYGGSDTPNIIVSGKIWANKKVSLNKNILIKNFYFFISCIFSFLLFLWALYAFNVFIFSSISFLDGPDLPILRLFNKKIIFVFFGSESRPLYISNKENEHSIGKFTEQISRQKRKLQKIEKYADVIISNPPSSQFLEKKFIQWLTIGIPQKYTSSTDFVSVRENSKIRIFHSPSNPVLKGTEKIRKSIQALKEKGYEIEYVEVIGKQHSIVIDELKKCDFAIDQIYSDTPMATFATEAAWHGKPSVVGGYYADYILCDVSEDMIPPSLYCHPDKIQDSIERMIVDTSFRNDMGKKAMEFVQKNWSPDKIAERYLRLIKGDIPAEWYYDPNNIQYLQGGGASEQFIKEILKAIIEYSGIDSLQVSDKPNLEKRFKDFAGK
jgi:glycosyltransferase involved in cell wall biosynthesis